MAHQGAASDIERCLWRVDVNSPTVRRLSSDDVRHDVRRERENECLRRT